MPNKDYRKRTPKPVTAPGQQYSEPKRFKAPSTARWSGKVTVAGVNQGKKARNDEDLQHQWDWEHSLDPTIIPPPSNPQKRRKGNNVPRKLRAKRTKETKNRKLHEHWDQSMEDLVSLTWTQTGRAAEGEFQSVVASLKAEFEAKLQVIMHTCPNRASTENSTKLPGPTMFVVDLPGHFDVQWPRNTCKTCDHTWSPHPVDVGTFPATPVQPQTVYTNRLLSLTTNVKFEGHISMHAWSNALHDFHRGQMQDVVLGFSQLWDNLGVCWERWRTVQKRATNLDNLGVEPIVSGWLGCAACVKTIRGAMSDACMGVTRLLKAAKSQFFRSPQNTDSIFVNERKMQDLLEERKKVDPKILEKVECNNHLAANVQGRKSDMYDVQGIAATVCRHEQVG